MLADTAVSVHEELPMLALRIFPDVGVTVIPPLCCRSACSTDYGRAGR